MKSYRLILMGVAVGLVVWAIKVYAGQIQLTTYYPAPTGNYTNLTVTQKLTLSGITLTGKAVCIKTDKSLSVCSSSVGNDGSCLCN